MSTPTPKPLKNGAEMDLSGRQLGDFQLLRRLGRGAMAEVYLAEQLSLKRRVAIKILKAELADDPTYLQRFVIEAQAAASLVQANIVQIYEVGHVDRWHYIAQEYIQGQNLQDWLTRNGPPDLPHALSIMRQVAAALAKAAEMGVVHRDIKPENIMLTGSGEVKVADFGLARLTRDSENNQLTQVGITLGTPLYMSPEQVEGRTLDPRSDIYSFGVTCYHMLTGAPPFSGETALAVAIQHMKTPPKPLESIRTDLPPALCRLVHSMLAKVPDRRCGSAREIVREVRRLQLEHGGKDLPEDLPGWETLDGEYPHELRIAATQQLDDLMKTLAMQQPKRFRWWRFVVATLGAFLFGGTLAWFLLSGHSLLANAQTPETPFPQAKTAAGQYLLASKFGTEQAWKSLPDRFPKDLLYTPRAKEQLSLIYLDRHDYKQAMAVFDDLVNMGNDWKESKAFGLAGQCIVYSLNREYDKSAETLNELYPLRSRLRNPVMLRLLEVAIRSNRPKLDSLKSGTVWTEWFESNPPKTTVENTSNE